jgi:hypothetical protein
MSFNLRSRTFHVDSIRGQLKSYLWGIDGDRTIVHDQKSCDRQWRHRKSRDRKRAWPELTGGMLCACPAFSRVFSLTIVVVQVPGLPEVTEGHVTPSGFLWVWACATGSWAISTLVGPFILHIKSYAPTTVLFLHIQGYVPYCSVIPTWIVMSHTVVLNLHFSLHYALQ